MDVWIKELIGRNVVLDTQGPMMYLGRLEAVSPYALLLMDADVHDRSDGHAGKELYALEARRHGVRANRRRVIVQRREVVSISALDDVEDLD